MYRRLSRIVLVMIVALVSSGATEMRAQDETYRFDLGAGVGMSGYLGDVNRSNMFRRPGFVAQLSFRYLIDTRWAIRTLFTTASLSGNSADFGEVFPGGAAYSFRSQIYDLGCRAEFNFFSYGIGETYKRLRRWSPYMALGVGVTLGNPGDGVYAGFSVPMAFGVKFKVRPRLNIAAEFCVTKVFSDHIDWKDLSDLYQIMTSFLKNSDWHSNILISLTYEFGKRCETCHYVD